MKRMADPTGSIVENLLAGVGKGMTDIGQGVGQTLGLQSRQDVEEKRRLDAPLMGTTAGKVGNFVGVAAPLALTAAIPGANTVAGAGAIGAGTGALMPSTSTKETLLNTGLGGVFGANAQLVGSGLRDVARLGTANAGANAATLQSQNAVKDATLRTGQEAGYVVPPSAVGKSFVGRRLESIAGKAAIGQEAAIRNQKVTNALARQEAGLSPNQAISRVNLKQAREVMSGPYREVANVSPVAKTSLEQLKEARANATQWYQYHDVSKLPTALTKAERYKNEALRLESLIDQEAVKAGRPDLLPALRDARVKLAKNYSVERAVNVGSGEVDASVLGRMADRGDPMTGGLKTIGEFQQAFRPYMREGGLVPTPGVSKSEALAGALLGTAGAGAAGPVGIMAGGLPLASGPARSMLLSRPVQDALAHPSYGPGIMRQGMLGAPQNPYGQALLRGGILAIPPTVQQ